MSYYCYILITNTTDTSYVSEIAIESEDDMKLLITLLIGLMATSFVHARDAVKTNAIDSWGYQQDHLVLNLHSGETILVEPKLCSIEDFNQRMTSGADLSLEITANRVRDGVPFYIVDQRNERSEKLRCRVASLNS